MIKNVKLKEAKAYNPNGDEWFLKLVYTYENDDGIHERVYPKVGLPISQYGLPADAFGCFRPHISTMDEMPLYLESIKDPRNGNLLSPACIFDILVEPKTRKMTIEEIEKKLGYKVEIVSGKKKE